MVDAASGGTLASKTPEEALQLIETMAANNYLAPSERLSNRRGVMELDTLDAILAQNKSGHGNGECEANATNQTSIWSKLTSWEILQGNKTTLTPIITILGGGIILTSHGVTKGHKRILHQIKLNNNLKFL
ncbi:hypothetical protein PIB30_105344 [Stylosanthes scabra]|uniref:Uncharacterized protein n=1 Tax=Stylosanthes scabra TaxID=79078 RepID=A0ABU6TY29_9FABA|nr:hypothetical protein [Stylosanthes scabra]